VSAGTELAAISRHLGKREAAVVAVAPGTGDGYWAGAPSAVWHDGAIWMAYRLRRPVNAGRGYANVVARSPDGYHFEPVTEMHKEDFDCASLERPSLTVTPDGDWALFVSCSSEGSKHWWVDVVRAAEPHRLGARGRLTVMAGDAATAWKDPVVSCGTRGWEMWACRHQIEPPEDADRMDSWYATSADGVAWELRGVALRPTPGTWDGRGARITAVVGDGGAAGGWTALYDGRASATENWRERTGLALGEKPWSFKAVGRGPVAAGISLRYASPVRVPDGGWFVYYEWELTDGTHDLRVEYVPPPASLSQSS
jgi:hypothetical protein